MTEEEAKTKWCPFGRILAGTDGTPPLAASYNRSSELDEPRCIASACMAWRWADPTTPHMDDRAELGGFCGLAGQPS